MPQLEGGSIILRAVRFLPLLASIFLAKTAFAAPLPALEGTISQTQNGVTTRARLAWLPPETLSIEVLPDAAANVGARTTLARGDETIIVSSSSKRARRYAFNVAKSWWRGSNLSSGGPANFLFAGTAFPIRSDEGRFLRRDSVIFGGGGKDSYYAAVKTPARRFAEQIVVSPATRTEKNAAGTVISSAQITLDNAGLPRTATLSTGGETATFAYDLKTVAAPKIAPEIAAPILEDDELQAPSAYAGADASSLFNRGAALALNEDFAAARAAFEAAAALAPDASAPPSVLFDLALSLRDPAGASTALGALERIGLGAGEIEVRRARLALLLRDDAGALAAFKAAVLALPSDMSLRLAQAEIARGSGDIEGARALYLGILSEKTPQFGAQASAAQSLALFATFAEIPTVLTNLPDVTEAQKLARALLQLRAGQETGTQETNVQETNAPVFSQSEFQVALALGFERAARDDDAQKIWQSIERSGPQRLKNRARAHLMTLFARRGEVSNSISQWRAWNASLQTQADQGEARSEFLRAWQKAFRSAALPGALANRAAATGASEDDLRLLLSYQELYGDAEQIAAAIESGAIRFSKSAFWKGKRAEIKIQSANEARGTQNGGAVREQLYDQALALLDGAIESAPDQPFFAFQRALAATQRASKSPSVTDAATPVRNRARAAQATARLLADFPGDPDALVSAALQNLASTSDQEKSATEAIRLATLALESAPGDGDRHSLVWAARQALASGYQRLNQPAMAAEQWEILLAGARDAGEQSTLAASYFALLESASDANPGTSVQGAARLLARLAGENWGYSASRALLEATALRMAISPRAAAISKALLALPAGSATLAAATLNLRRVEVAQRALEAPEAPPAADANLDRANRDLGAALEKLRPVAGSPSRVLAARAAAFLAENAALDGAERFALLHRALELEPRDAALRFALIGALDGDDAQKERDFAARTLDFDPETWRGLSAAARRAGDFKTALKWGEEAFNGAARAPEIGGTAFQRVAFAAAKSAFAASRNPRALEIYRGLSLPQWNDIDRAAALLALSRNLKEAGRDADALALNPKVAALDLSQRQIETAIAFIDEVEN